MAYNVWRVAFAAGLVALVQLGGALARPAAEADTRAASADTQQGSSLVAQVAALVAANAALKSSVDKLVADVSTLKTGLSTAQATIATLQSDLSTARTTITTLTADVTALKAASASAPGTAITADSLDAKRGTARATAAFSTSEGDRDVFVVWPSRNGDASADFADSRVYPAFNINRDRGMGLITGGATADRPAVYDATFNVDRVCVGESCLWPSPKYPGVLAVGDAARKTTTVAVDTRPGAYDRVVAFQNNDGKVPALYYNQFGQYGTCNVDACACGHLFD
ncbi:hypothetical protein HXX76_000863 [Chlamydomonas incerta]|uniref:Uncharacterized protein n=1 Tax=Chlamydomonas incerta TaxID=51695 RepID=A0A836B3J5_CHLIN|nr:hypothetical protein HXX76_000863 [Chlamydomonas incerta]|eukprot:KAG2446274.1 hypothetical protein HXX76_000863 [Chlamydomonas incerta]